MITETLKESPTHKTQIHHLGDSQVFDEQEFINGRWVTVNDVRLSTQQQVLIDTCWNLKNGE